MMGPRLLGAAGAAGLLFLAHLPVGAAGVSAAVAGGAEGAEGAGGRRVPARVTDLVESVHRRHEVPALAGAIVREEGVVALGATGSRRKGAPERVAPGDLWHLGSCTKAMTATVIGLLVERGRLRWETTLGETLPEMAERMDPAYRDVNIQQLLAHRGGTPRELDAELWGQLWKREGTPREQRWALVQGVLSVSPAAQPGTKHIYSNAGYAIAGAIAEKVMETPFEELVSHELFRPLGMSSAGFGAPGRPGKITQPRGHRGGVEKCEPVEPGRDADNPPAIGPAGTVHASLEDWGRFVALHLRGARGGRTLLEPATVRRLHTPPAGQDYALGWIATRREWGGRVLTHSGSNTMWFAVAWLAPEKGFAVLATTNVGGDAAQKACDELAWALIQHALAAAPRGG